MNNVFMLAWFCAAIGLITAVIFVYGFDEERTAFCKKMKAYLSFPLIFISLVKHGINPFAKSSKIKHKMRDRLTHKQKQRIINNCIDETIKGWLMRDLYW